MTINLKGIYHAATAETEEDEKKKKDVLYEY